MCVYTGCLGREHCAGHHWEALAWKFLAVVIPSLDVGIRRLWADQNGAKWKC